MSKKKSDPPKTYTPTSIKLNYLLAGDFMMDLHDFMYARLERLDPLKTSREYSRLHEKAEFLITQIRTALPEFNAKLNDLCDTYTGMGAQVSELYYRRGFSDGVMIIIQALVASA